MNSFEHLPSSSPTTRRVPHTDCLHGQEIADPYRWLEDVDSQDIAEWIREQNAHTQQALQGIAFGQHLRERVGTLSLFENVGMPKRGGRRLFFTVQGPRDLQPSLVWMDKDGGELHALIDPATMADDAAVSVSGFDPSPSGRYVAVGLSEAGSDWQTWRIIDVDTGEPLRDELRWIRFTITSWRADETGFFYSGSEPPPENEVFKAPATRRRIRFHRLGEPQDNDAVIFDRQIDPTAMSYGRVTSDDRYLVIWTQRGTYRQNLVDVLDLSESQAGPRALVSEFSASYVFLGNRGSTLFFWTNDDAPYGRIVAIDLASPESSSWREVVAESKGVIESAAYVGGNFVISTLVDAESKVLVYEEEGTRRYELDLPGRGSVPLVDGRAQGADVYLWYSAPAQPATILHHDLSTQRTAPFRAHTLPFDPENYITERHTAISADGTEIPIFLSRKKTTKVGLDTPTCLYGYGGFNISCSPDFRLDHLSWMDMGGQLAVACIRGGGEFGEAWHQAGVGVNRPNVFDDFIAAAEWLIETKRTSTPKLVIHGRSNGGLLIGACMTKRPDLFGACLPAVGVLDMLRFHKFTVGAFWTSDYGSPEDEDLFSVLLSYSPLHNVEEGRTYPPTLVTTADHDDRVFPAHSFKFAAALQHAQSGTNPILLRVEERAGHGLGKPKDKLLDEIADNWIFAFAALDTAPQFPDSASS